MYMGRTETLVCQFSKAIKTNKPNNGGGDSNEILLVIVFRRCLVRRD